MSGPTRRALVVRGGWEGHEPVEATDLFLGELKEAGFDVVATFADSPDYLRMVGGLFLFHPADFLRYRVVISPEHAEHPIMAGLTDFDVYSEQYWMLSDGLNTVLASTAVDPADGGRGGAPLDMPVVWTRRWGKGKIFFSAIGHRTADLRDPTVRTLTRRGLVWAAR